METDSPVTTAEKKPPKLRWFQYRLRSLFVLTTLVAIACSWLTVTIQNGRKQMAAADAIVKAGGEVTSEPTWLGELLRDDSLVRVTDVDLYNTTNAGLVHLQSLSQLLLLSLADTQVTDAGLVNLQGLSQLQVLNLDNTRVTDTGLLHLEGLSQLEGLGLNKTQITDAGLVHLRGLSRLRSLTLENTKVTDTGLLHLQGMSQLKWLRLNGTQVTDQGVKNLQQALPNCKIER